MPNYGVIDLGSNTIRLCVYEVKDDKKSHYRKKDIRGLLNNKVVAGLSAHVKDGVFQESGIIRALEVLRGHQKRLRYFDCKNTDVFATAVLRNCLNSKEAIQAIEDGSGFSITLLSGEDEAHLGFVGATSDQEITEGTLVDIGGGSTELTRVKFNKDSHNLSVAQGSLSSFVSHVQAIMPTPEEMASITKSYRKALKNIPTKGVYEHKHFFGIGGSIRAMTKVYGEAFNQGVRPDTLTLSHLDRLFDFYREEPHAFSHTVLKIVPERIHTFIPGCLILYTLLNEFDGTEVSVRSNGVREGYLIERMLLAK